MEKDKKTHERINQDVKDQVTVPVDGTVVDWAAKVQVNPETGQRFDFQGNLLGTDPKAPSIPKK